MTAFQWAILLGIAAMMAFLFYREKRIQRRRRR